MRLTTFTDFGLRVLMRLAGSPGRVVTTEALAAELAVSRHHLTKVVRALGSAGFVSTARGAGGGLRLARPAGAITVGDVVRRLEGRHALVECFRADGGACVLMPGCRLKKHLARARETFLAELETVTIAECAVAPPTASAAAP
ncbi:MAG: Rrf2 family transcriptional regulator [Geminicoccaceae bacterium]